MNALDEIKQQITRPIPVSGREEHFDPDNFDPWEAFPCIYGSYSSEFDDMAILVLENLVNRTLRREETLAHEMFREMLCTANLCDYGTSPRGCFPTPEFAAVLPSLLDKWREYARVVWAD